MEFSEVQKNQSLKNKILYKCQPKQFYSRIICIFPIILLIPKSPLAFFCAEQTVNFFLFLHFIFRFQSLSETNDGIAVLSEEVKNIFNYAVNITK